MRVAEDKRNWKVKKKYIYIYIPDCKKYENLVELLEGDLNRSKTTKREEKQALNIEFDSLIN